MIYKNLKKEKSYPMAGFIIKNLFLVVINLIVWYLNNLCMCFNRLVVQKIQVLTGIRIMNRTFNTVILLLGFILVAVVQAEPSVYVDDKGTMRFAGTNEEVALFGVNYTTPFAHAYRAHNYLGVSHYKAIDADVYHFTRLGFDAYRIHVWDAEISDKQGNLIENEHLRLLDYLLAKLKECGIKTIITPLTYYTNGYPEPGTEVPGWSPQFGKGGNLNNKETWPLQQRYLSQFMNHVNAFTNVAYKDNPDVIAIEINNEPGHRDYDLTLEYINTMVKAVRDTGYEQPIFYNMSHGQSVYEAYLNADIQGGTFQWYPSGLVAGRERQGNYLPHVDVYPIPFANHENFRNKARMVYEYDAADIGRSYMYPAMARSYRTAGFQFAAQFAYDPMYMAAFNTEYQTHYLNLAYAPQKALSMKIASEAFHRIPLFKDYGQYPNNTVFEDFHVSYTEDLSELVSEEKFFYTNNTSSIPPAPERLRHIAGYGNSPIIKYHGYGVYFLDRLEEGVWRLEVMPDAVWVRDPFERASLKKHVSRIAWNELPMTVDLPDLGENFKAAGLNDGNNFSGRAANKTINIRPGAYLLTGDGVKTDWDRDNKWENIVLKEFIAPEASLDKMYVLHEPIAEASAGKTLELKAMIVSPDIPEKVELIANLPRQGGRGRRGFGRGSRQTLEMKKISCYEYSAEIPGDQIVEGVLSYYIGVQGRDVYVTYPSGISSRPSDWDFYGDSWNISIVNSESPIILFDAAADADSVIGGRNQVVSMDIPGSKALAFEVNNLSRGEHDQTFRHFFKEKVLGRLSDLDGSQVIFLHGKSLNDKPCKLQVAVITDDGICYGEMVTILPEADTYSIPVSSLRKVRSVNLPTGYPVFLPYWFETDADLDLDMSRIEGLQISLGPGVPESEYGDPHGVLIERIWLD